jgi:ATP-binding protein involved in chromosome partitioning
VNIPVLGLIENMAYFTPAELPGNKYYIFGKGGCRRLAEEWNVPFLGEIPLVQGICEGGDSGHPIVLDESSPSSLAFLTVAGNVAQQVAIRNARLSSNQPVTS